MRKRPPYDYSDLQALLKKLSLEKDGVEGDGELMLNQDEVPNRENLNFERVMGITFVKMRVSNPARPKKAFTKDFLVDSGAVYSVMPAKELKALGIKPVRKEEFLLANGEKVTKGVGNAFFEFQGKIGAAPVIFGDEGIFLLGATTLESVGLMLDPLRRELKPLPMLLMAIPKQTPVQLEN